MVYSDYWPAHVGNGCLLRKSSFRHLYLVKTSLDNKHGTDKRRFSKFPGSFLFFAYAAYLSEILTEDGNFTFSFCSRGYGSHSSCTLSVRWRLVPCWDQPILDCGIGYGKLSCWKHSIPSFGFELLLLLVLLDSP